MSLVLGAISKIWRKPKDHLKQNETVARDDSGQNDTLRLDRRREHAREYAKKDEEDTVIDYNAPIHWWVVSTLFPLIAGTFGPMASKTILYLSLSTLDD